MSSFINEIMTVFFTEKYKEIPFGIRLKIYLTTMNNPYKPYYDVLIETILKNKDNITKVEKSSYTITLKFKNNTNVDCWIGNLWYAFLSEFTLTNFKKVLPTRYYKRGRPSRMKMLDFLCFILSFCKLEYENFELNSVANIQKFFNFSEGPDDVETRTVL